MSGLLMQNGFFKDGKHFVKKLSHDWSKFIHSKKIVIIVDEASFEFLHLPSILNLFDFR